MDENECGKCGKEVKNNLNGIECELCEKWYHCGCLKISKSEYDHTGEIEGKVSWFCPPCKTDFKNLESANAELRKENQELKQMIESMTDRLDSIEKRLDSGSHDTNIPTRNDPEHLEELIYENIKE